MLGFFFTLQEPDANGWIECLGRAPRLSGITNIQDKASINDGRLGLIGVGTDGASVNMSEQNGMIEKLQQVCPWIFGRGALHITESLHVKLLSKAN